jgi:hypothetical protein
MHTMRTLEKSNAAHFWNRGTPTGELRVLDSWRACSFTDRVILPRISIRAYDTRDIARQYCRRFTYKLGAVLAQSTLPRTHFVCPKSALLTAKFVRL